MPQMAPMPLRAIRRTPQPRHPIFAVTANHFTNRTTRTLSCRRDEPALAKPPDPDLLLQAVLEGLSQAARN